MLFFSSQREKMLSGYKRCILAPSCGDSEKGQAGGQPSRFTLTNKLGFLNEKLKHLRTTYIK